MRVTLYVIVSMFEDDAENTTVPIPNHHRTHPAILSSTVAYIVLTHQLAP